MTDRALHSVAIAAALSTAGLRTLAQGDGSNDPAAELASFKVAEGFEVNLFASEKNGIIKPIQMRWDTLGRLWVIGSETYPQVKPTEEPNDKVWILEDTDNDGSADRTTVFVDGLMIPTGLELVAPSMVMPKSASAYIGEGTKLWLMTDDDGDGKADRREVVLRGFGTGDNHQNLNSFRWSPGGELMFCQGLHAFSRVETPYGLVMLDEAGLWRFRPREHRLDAFYGGAADPQNPWGWVWTRWGQPIVVAGNNGAMFYPVPEMIRGWQGGRRDSIWAGKGRKTSGPEIIETRHFPEAWQGVMVAGGYINNAVWTLKIEDDGAGFHVVDHPVLPPLLQSTHGSFRPVDVKLGPDGALYVCDWYNPIIGHYQASFRHPDRDKQHGRIWRVRWKGDPNPTPTGRASIRLLDGPELSDVEKARIAEALARHPRSPEERARDQMSEIGAILEIGVRTSERYERERLRSMLWSADSSAVTAAVFEWIAGRNPSRADHEEALLEALMMLEAHETIDAAFLQRALGAKSPAVRAYAAGVVARCFDRPPIDLSILNGLTVLAIDSHPRVRLAAIVAAGNIPRVESTFVVLTAAEQPRDKFIDTALRAAVAVLSPHWKAMAEQGAPQWKPHWPELLAELGGRKVAVVAKPGKPAIPATSTPAPLVPVTGQLKATPDFVAALVTDVRAKGDPKRGADVYRRSELICTTCHKIGDQGGIIGPALDTIGSAQPLDFIIGAVLEPQREVKEGFETISVALKDRRILIGTVVAGTKDRYTLRDAAGTETTIESGEVTERKPIGSLMPAGLVDRLSRNDLRDLFAYLASLGKPN